MPARHDQLKEDCQKRFCELVESVGVKRYAEEMSVSTRQINRVLSGAQPNPIERVIQCLQAAETEVGDQVLDFMCQELGGHFVRQEGMNDSAISAVRECAEAIAAISDGQVGEIDLKEIRDAISALSGLILAIRRTREK